MFDLSILIPARQEMFLAKTVQDILDNSEGNTEVIVVLDGAWADPGIEDNNKVTIVYLSESVGQRAATNLACKLSKAKYVMKADAHTAWDKGFDVKMLEAFKEVGDNVTMVPVMKNLHAFNWVCPDGHTRYQGPSGDCQTCGKPTERDVVWRPKPSPNSTSYRFDTDMHFQYFGQWKKQQDKTGKDLVETFSLQGSAFMMTREKYWELDICDESWGSWGQQGVEVAVKTWLSGGKVLCNKRTWYAHMFRTQGGDFSFPYKQRPQSEIVALREFTKDLFMNNKWPKAVKTFQWLLDKFKPLPGWHDGLKEREIGDMEIPDDDKKGIIFYTDNQLKLKIAHAVQNQLKSIGLPITSASLKPMSFGDNVVVHGERGYDSYFRQIIAALEKSTAEIVYFCEHDVLYPKEHFEFTPPDDNFYYDHNWWKIGNPDDKDMAVRWDADQVSGLICKRLVALDWYKKKYEQFNREKFDRKFEPKSGDGAKTFRSSVPSIDIRAPRTLTKSKWSIDDFRDKSSAKSFEVSTIDKIPGWDTEQLKQLIKQ